MNSYSLDGTYDLWIVDLKFSTIDRPRLQRTGDYALYFAWNANPEYGKLLSYSHREEGFSLRPSPSRDDFYPVHRFNIAISRDIIRHASEDSDVFGHQEFRGYVHAYKDQDRFLKPLLEAFQRCINIYSSEYIVNDKANPGSYFVVRAWLNELVKARILSPDQVQFACRYLDEDWRNVGRQLFVLNGGRT